MAPLVFPNLLLTALLLSKLAYIPSIVLLPKWSIPALTMFEPTLEDSIFSLCCTGGAELVFSLERFDNLGISALLVIASCMDKVLRGACFKFSAPAALIILR